MKVLVCGGRDYSDWTFLKSKLDEIHNFKQITLLIHGGAKGADTLSGRWAKLNNIEVKVFEAQWKKFGNAAGYIRNKQMLKEGDPDLVVVFSGAKGTEMMYNISLAARKEIIDLRGE